MTNHLFTAISEGKCIAEKRWAGWHYVWTETTSTGYTRWCRAGAGSALGTAGELISDIQRNPDLWAILNDN